MKEKLTLVFEKDGRSLRYKWVIKKGFRGARDANKVRKLHQELGDPIEIIGDGPVANLLRREYEIYKVDPKGYGGVSIKDILVVGGEVTGVPVQRLKRGFSSIKSKLKRK